MRSPTFDKFWLLNNLRHKIRHKQNSKIKKFTKINKNYEKIASKNTEQIEISRIYQFQHFCNALKCNGVMRRHTV